MKGWGIFFIITGALNVIIHSIGLATYQTPYPEQSARNIAMGFGLIVLGIYLIHRANKKKQERIDRQNWENGNK